MLTGSLGMLPSASLGSVDQNTGKRHAMYEPVHGSAPDIAGKELANPLAELLSLSMLFRYSFEMKEEADLICLIYTSPSPRDSDQSRMPSSA